MMDPNGFFSSQVYRLFGLSQSVPEHTTNTTPSKTNNHRHDRDRDRDRSDRNGSGKERRRAQQAGLNDELPSRTSPPPAKTVPLDVPSSPSLMAPSTSSAVPQLPASARGRPMTQGDQSLPSHNAHSHSHSRGGRSPSPPSSPEDATPDRSRDDGGSPLSPLSPIRPSLFDFDGHPMEFGERSFNDVFDFDYSQPPKQISFQSRSAPSSSSMEAAAKLRAPIQSQVQVASSSSHTRAPNNSRSHNINNNNTATFSVSNIKAATVAKIAYFETDSETEAIKDDKAELSKSKGKEKARELLECKPIERFVPLDDLLPTVADWAVCAVCNEVFKKARVTPECGHTFCSGCVTLLLEKPSTSACPLCRKPFPEGATIENFLPNHQLTQVIDSLQVRCKWGMQQNDLGVWTEAPEGCKEVVEWQNSEAHSAVCPFAVLRCPFRGCDAQFLRREKVAHLSACVWRTSTCKRCRAEVPSRQKEAHRSECPFAEWPCPNRCGETVFLKDKDTHLERTCPELVVACPNSAFGCVFKTKKASLHLHLSVSECPFERFRPFFEVTARSLEELNAKLTRQSTVIESQQREIDALRRALYGRAEGASGAHRSSSSPSSSGLNLLSRSPSNKESSSPSKRKTSSSSSSGLASSSSTSQPPSSSPNGGSNTNNNSNNNNSNGVRSYQLIEEDDSASAVSNVRLSMNSL